jgi:hypothetical protein
MEFREILNRRAAYLPTIKAGDVIHILSSHNHLQQMKVVKITKTQIVIEWGDAQKFQRRYRLDDGYEITSSRYYRNQIIDPEWAKEIRASRKAEHEYRTLLGTIQNFNWKNFDQDDSDLLRKAVDFLTALDAERVARQDKEAGNGQSL